MLFGLIAIPMMYSPYHSYTNWYSGNYSVETFYFHFAPLRFYPYVMLDNYYCWHLCFFRKVKTKKIVDPVRSFVKKGQILRGYVVQSTKTQLLVRYVYHMYLGGGGRYKHKPIISYLDLLKKSCDISDLILHRTEILWSV